MLKRLLTLGLFILSLASCIKEHAIQDQEREKILLKQRGEELLGLPPTDGTMPTNKVHITLNSSNHYISSYGGGIDFGTNLPHALSNPNGMYDGQPVPTITYVGVIGNSSLATTTIEGSYFLVIVPTYPPPSDVLTKINEYRDAVHKYFRYMYGKSLGWIINPEPPYPIPLGLFIGEAGAGIREIRGMVIYDHTSPTGMSVCNDSYIPPTLSRIIALFNSGGYNLRLYGTLNDNGSIIKVEVKNSANQLLTVSDYNITYNRINGGDYFHIEGYIKLSSGTIISLNEDVFRFGEV